MAVLSSAEKKQLHHSGVGDGTECCLQYHTVPLRSLHVLHVALQSWYAALPRRILATSQSRAVSPEQHRVGGARSHLRILHVAIQSWYVALPPRIMAKSQSRAVSPEQPRVEGARSHLRTH